MTEGDAYPLDAVTTEFLEQRLKQIAAIEANIGGALDLWRQQQGLTGWWALDWPNRQLVKRTAEQLQAA